MTDRQTLEAMFARAGIVWTEAEDHALHRGAEGVAMFARSGMTAPESPEPDPHSMMVVTVEQHDNHRVRGYSGFLAEFGFDVDGALMFIAVWE